jgi:hypothetical protein
VDHEFIAIHKEDAAKKMGLGVIFFFVTPSSILVFYDIFVGYYPSCHWPSSMVFIDNIVLSRINNIDITILSSFDILVGGHFLFVTPSGIKYDVPVL